MFIWVKHQAIKLSYAIIWKHERSFFPYNIILKTCTRLLNKVFVKCLFTKKKRNQGFSFPNEIWHFLDCYRFLRAITFNTSKWDKINNSGCTCIPDKKRVKAEFVFRWNLLLLFSFLRVSLFLL